MIGQVIPARKIEWAEVGAAIKSELKNLLGKDIDCVAGREDYDYWGVRLVGYEMPITEVELLLNMLEADEEMRDESIPLPEDNETAVKSLGMQICRALLSRQIQCGWEKELLDGQSISLLEISIKN